MVDPSLVLNGIQVAEGSGGFIHFLSDKTVKGQFNAALNFLKFALDLLQKCEKMPINEKRLFLGQYDVRKAELLDKEHYKKFPHCINPISWNEMRIIVGLCQGLYIRVDRSSESVKREQEQIKLLQQLSQIPEPQRTPSAVMTMAPSPDPAIMDVLSSLTDSIHDHKSALQELSHVLTTSTEGSEEASNIKRLFIKFARHVILEQPIGMRDPFSDAAQVGLRRTISAPSSAP